MKIELKPCPKCGHKKIWVMHGITQKKWWCECFKCDYCGKESRFKALAKILWNRSVK